MGDVVNIMHANYCFSFSSYCEIEPMTIEVADKHDSHCSTLAPSIMIIFPHFRSSKTKELYHPLLKFYINITQPKLYNEPGLCDLEVDFIIFNSLAARIKT